MSRHASSLAAAHTFASALYRGELMHARHDAIAKRAFRYGVYMAALDLDELPRLDRSLRLFSHRGRNLFAFDERDYQVTLGPSTAARQPDLRESLAALRTANGLAVPDATRLVTNLRVAGYVFNPVSLFLDYDASGAITSVIAEVNNTYGGAFRYVLGPRQRITDASTNTALAQDTPVGFRHVRELFVSPFLHGPATYDFWFEAPRDGRAIAIEMHVTRGDDGLGPRLFTARFTGQRTPLSDRALAGAALRYPLMTAQVIGLIHLQAVKMRLARVPYRRPGADHRPLGEPTTLCSP